MIGDILAICLTASITMFMIGVVRQDGWLFVIGQILSFIFSVVAVVGFVTGALPA